VITPLNPTGTVQVGSELWTASLEEAGTPLKRGEKIVVTGVERLEVKVRKAE
jgi:membrane-bound ClpP family serine protease